MTMYWEETAERMARGELNRYQLELLNQTIERARKAQFYRSFDLSRVDSLAQFQANFPFTCKQDLRDHFPYGFLTTDLTKVIRLHSSSGTTGNPTVVFHTERDVAEWTNQVARCLYMAGVRKGDVFQNTMGYGLFTGGLGFHYGAEKLGRLQSPLALATAHDRFGLCKPLALVRSTSYPVTPCGFIPILKRKGLTRKA